MRSKFILCYLLFNTLFLFYFLSLSFSMSKSVEDINLNGLEVAYNIIYFEFQDVKSIDEAYCKLDDWKAKNISSKLGALKTICDYSPISLENISLFLKRKSYDLCLYMSSEL